MGNWWLAIFLAAFIVAMVGYYLWSTYFMRPEDASEVGAAGSAPDFYDQREHRDRKLSEIDRSRGMEEPGTPLS